jgi:hypothetical protein
MPRLCVRDERGWLVPATGTMARTVYDVLVAAEQSGEEFDYAVLAQLLGTSPNSVYVMASRIRCGAHEVTLAPRLPSSRFAKHPLRKQNQRSPLN